MGIWKMSQLKGPPLTEDPAELRKYINYLSNQMAIMMKDLDFTLNGDINFQNVKAKSITADRLTVTELSAITANMGKLTSGEIYGAYIATKEAAYPRAEMSSTNNLFSAKYDADNYVSIDSSIGSAPGISLVSPLNTLGLASSTTGSSINADTDLTVSSNFGSLYLRTEFGNVVISSFDVIYSTFDGKSVGTIFQELSDRITALGG